MEQERVRIVDIAKELGLSTATVSNVIHGKTKKISHRTVQRVQQLLEERGYIPNMAAILLAQNDSKILGAVINAHEKYEGRVLEDGFIAASLNALSQEVNRAGLFLMVKVTSAWDEIAGFASMWNMEGLVLIGFCEQDYKQLRDSIRVPFVIYDGFLSEGEKLCNLAIDHYGGGYQVGAYLRRMGHERVLGISDNEQDMDLERLKGCRAGMGPFGIDVLKIPCEKEKRQLFYEEHLEELLRHSAIFAVSDYYAIDVMHFLEGKGIWVPEDISVVGFDDSPWCDAVSPPLTTIGYDRKRRAERTIHILRELKKGTWQERSVTLPTQLVERKSVKRLDEKGEEEKWNENWS